MADADDRVPCRPSGRIQPGDRVFGGRIVTGWQGRGLHPLLHVDNEQDWWLRHADSSMRRSVN